jgi:LPS-assembly protein
MRGKRFIIVACLAGFFSGNLSAQAEVAGKEMRTPIEITADGENRFEAGLAVATGNVIVRYGADVLYADRITYDTKKREVMADGNVRLYSGDKIYRGEMLRYNFESKSVVSRGFATVDYPLLANGKEVSTPGENHYRIKEGAFTTDNRANPSYRLKANTVEIYPDDQVVLKNVVVYIGNVPIAWVPIFVQSLQSNSSAYTFEVGSNGRFGAYFYNTYNWMVDKNLELNFHFDLRERRGLAGGVDARYKPTKEGEGLFKGYFAGDQDHLDNPSATPRDPIYEERYRFSLQQRSPFGTDLNTLVDLNLWSDPFVTADFFKDDYAAERIPDNFVNATYFNQNFTIDATMRAQVNRFYNTTERLPEVKFESRRVKLGGSDFAYEGETSIVNFRRTFANNSEERNYDAYRWDTFHQFLYPRQYFGWLSVTPRVGFRGTAWSDDNQITPNDSDRDLKGRLLGVVGTEASFKVSKSWTDVENKALGIYGLRHISQPYANVQYIPRPDTNPTEIRTFDERLPNTWAQPINLTSYNSIDSLDRQAVFRLGTFDKLQTKRDGKTWDLASWNLFGDFFYDKQRTDLQQEVNQTTGPTYSDLSIKPLDWLTFRSQSAFDFKKDRYAMTDNSIAWQMTKYFESTLGNRYLVDAPQIVDYYNVPLPDSNLVYLRNFYRVNEHWQLESYHQFEADDRNLELQSYTIYRDLTSWQAAMTFESRDYRQRESEQTVYLTMTLKAFPEARFSLSQ